MIDCLLVTKPGFEWLSYVPYLVLVVGLIFGAGKWRKWERADKIIYVFALVIIFFIVWSLIFALTPRGCAGRL